MARKMDSRYHTLGSFDLVADAEILRIKLESEGIPVYLKDANILQAEPFIATAIGGVKVQVPLEYRQRAEVIYDQVRAYALDREGQPIVCPNCRAARSERYYLRNSLWYRLFPFLAPATYRCLSCGIITRREQ